MYTRPAAEAAGGGGGYTCAALEHGKQRLRAVMERANGLHELHRRRRIQERLHTGQHTLKQRLCLASDARLAHVEGGQEALQVVCLDDGIRGQLVRQLLDERQQHGLRPPMQIVCHRLRRNHTAQSDQRVRVRRGQSILKGAPVVAGMQKSLDSKPLRIRVAGAYRAINLLGQHAPEPLHDVIGHCAVMRRVCTSARRPPRQHGKDAQQPRSGVPQRAELLTYPD